MTQTLSMEMVAANTELLRQDIHAQVEQSLPLIPEVTYVEMECSEALTTPSETMETSLLAMAVMLLAILNLGMTEPILQALVQVYALRYEETVF